MSKPQQFDRAKEMERRIQRTMGECVHFTGVHNETCRAGVNYRALVGGDDFGWVTRLPCLRFLSKEMDRCNTCDKMQLPSRAEAEAQERAADEVFQRINVCLKAIRKKHGKARGLVDSMPCPNECGGTLRYSISGYNGHVHGQCSTKGCAQWMQ